MNEKMTLKEKIAVLKRSVALMNEADPGYTLRALCQQLPEVVSGFAGVTLASRVIDGVTSAKPIGELLATAAIACAVTLLAALLGHFIDKRQSSHTFILDQNLHKLLWKKVMELDYTRAEDVETMNKLRNARRWLDSGNIGMRRIVYHLSYLGNNLVSVIAGVALIAPIVFVRPAGGEGFWGFLQSPWGFLAVIAAIALITVFQSGVLAIRYTREEEKTHGDPRLLETQRVGNFICMRTLWNYRHGKEIRIYGERERILSQKREQDRIYTEMWEKNRRISARIVSIQAFLNLLRTVILYGFALARVFGGMISPGEVMAFVLYFRRISEGFFGLSANTTQMLSTSVFCKQVFDFLDLSDEKYQGTIPTEKRDDNEYEFEFKNVSFRYPGTEEYVLRNIDLKWRIGEKMALVGRNGSGKSTLVKLLCRLYDPTEGVITLNGIDIRKYSIKDYTDLFSVVFQDSSLFSFSIAENVGADTEYDPALVEDCVRRVGLSERLDAMPDGIETCLYKDFDERGVEISGGEAQKLCLARAIYKGAPFIVLDEPTAALDPISEYDIYTKFSGVVGTRTAIYISHRLSSCRFCDDITVLEKGRVAERGSHEALLEKNGAYAALWHAQAEYYKDTAGELFA
ncbi:MAG: ABC transporter ATP-binding protein/permease [Bacteroides sp.]|nr:ABC transporter ATP-binding protein/permease [Eubacterium sp.]MCM1417899.1 ABC transporter ATP-binding protein/permease [Roseburia sp.]MCM1461937.1 ABC transporter ATP-binding protein/permease [Bacteroides sp.]